MKACDFKKNLRIVIQKERVKLGLTEKEFAHGIGINETDYIKIENGEDSISIEKLISISIQLKTPMSKLFDMAEKLN